MKPNDWHGAASGFYGRRYFVSPGKDTARESGYADYRHPRVRLRQAALAFALSRLFEFDSVLDVGCAFGHLLDAMLRLGKQAGGVEISRWAAQNALPHARGRLCTGTALALPFRDRATDLLVCQEVLEHIPPASLGSALEEIKRVANRILFLSVPVADWAQGLVPEDRLPRDHHGRPHHGHLTVADLPWWEKRLASGLSPWKRLDLGALVIPRADQGVFAFSREEGSLKPLGRPMSVALKKILKGLFG